MAVPSIVNKLFGSPTPRVDPSDPRVRRRLDKQMVTFDQMSAPRLPEVPSLISLREGHYLYWLTAQGYSGQGAVVELGSFLGSSAMHLGAGMRDAGFDRPLWCFDKFEWSGSAGWSERFRIQLADKVDYRPLFLRNVQPIYPAVRAVKTEIKRIKWKGGLVEILFMDAPKRLADISAALTQFGLSLEPNFSLIVCDDYNHAPSFELAAALSQLGSKLQLVHALTDSSTVSFILTDRLTRAETTEHALSFRNWTAAEARQRWRSILDLLPESARERLELGLAMLLHDLGHAEEAIAVVRATKLTASMIERWRGWAVPSLYGRYRTVFDAIGVRPASVPNGGAEGH